MKRGESGLSFVVGVDKPCGLTSHDVVSRCRRIFGEKRIGHTGTLDPMASGAMAVCVGPATKLSNFLTFHGKSYAARIVFGAATDTDDAEGEVIRTAEVPARLADEAFARDALAATVGSRNQLPPAYSAIKVGGVKSYEAARKGKLIELEPRPITVHGATLIGIGRTDAGRLFWDARFDVSAGTYIRSIARDLGMALGTCAHLGALRRLRSGKLAVGECVSLEALEADPALGRLDPIRLLDVRYLVLEDPAREKAVRNGGRIPTAGLVLFERRDPPDASPASFPCAPPIVQSERPLARDEVVGVLADNKLVALYAYDGGCLKSRCGFAQGVSRGIV